MKFEDVYTTTELITADKEGKESKKTVLTNDAYAIGKQLDRVVDAFERMMVKR